MARVFYGSQVTDIVGSIGGLTFQKNASGSIVRLRPNLSQQLSEAQILRTIVFAESQAVYQSLNSTQKNLWKAFAAAHDKIDYYGVTKSLSAQNWFSSLYLNAVSIGVTPLLVPPIYTVPTPIPAPNYYSFDTSYPYLKINWDDPVVLTGKTLMMYVSPISFVESLSDRSNIFYLDQTNVGGFTEIDFWQDYLDFWFSGNEFQIDSIIAPAIRVFLLAISNSSMLTSQFTSLVLSHGVVN